MGITRTLIAWLVVLGLQLTPHVTYAEDGGPGREVRAIRHDLPILLAYQLRGALDVKNLVVDRVTVSGNTAVVTWHDGEYSETSSLSHRLGQWWYGAALRQPLKAISGPPCIMGTDSYGYTLCLPLSNRTALLGTSILIRPPTEGESWLAYLGNGYCYFSMTFANAAAVQIDSGTQLDIWFPFVLDKSKTYSLTLAHADPTIGPINGRLKDNTLHFVLPAFAVAPGAELMGEIDGDPYDR